jgi:hypothetical protein
VPDTILMRRGRSIYRGELQEHALSGAESISSAPVTGMSALRQPWTRNRAALSQSARGQHWCKRLQEFSGVGNPSEQRLRAAIAAVVAVVALAQQIN